MEDSLEIVVSLTPFEEEQAPKVKLKPLPSTLRGETLLAVNTSVPWFADIVNFLVGGYIPKDFDYNKKKRFVHDVRDYFWDEPLLFRRGPDGIVRSHILHNPNPLCAFKLANPHPMDIFGVSCLQMRARNRKKSVAQKQPAAPPVPDTPLHDPKLFERFKFISERQIFKPYVLSLDVAAHFGIRDEVADLVDLPEWRYLLMEFDEDTHKDLLVEAMTTMKLTKFYGLTSSVCVQFHIGHMMFRFSPDNLSDLMGFGPVQQLTEEEKFDRYANVPNVQELWEELTDGTTVFRSSHSRSSEFLKLEHKFMQYQLGHSITGRFDATSSVNHADLFCLFGMVKRVRLHMGVVVWNLMKNQYYMRGTALYLGPYFTRILRATQQVVLTAPRATDMQPLTTAAVGRMADVADARREEEAYEANPDASGPAHVQAGGSSYSDDFQQQVLAQLAAMNMRFDRIDDRLEEMAAKNAVCRAEAQAYYEWMRGHYPPPEGPSFPPSDPSSMG
nr:uncharacterized protein LOC105953567 [Ipomoea batatas]